MKKFSKWAIHEVEREFHVRPVETHPLLTAWLNAELPITQEEDRQLLSLCHKLRQHVHLDFGQTSGVPARRLS